MWIKEELKTPIKKRADVLVCGGGVAGIAAAISAAREGKRVLLLEREYMLGGLATAGLVTIYLPLCDGMGRQVSFGIAEELLRLSVATYCDMKRGAKNWLFGENEAERGEKSPRFEVNFNPCLFAIDAERLLLDLGVEILYGTVAVAAHCEDKRITAVVVENKSGRFAICPDMVIDATGDADIGMLSGAPTVLFGQGNVLAAWYYSHGQDGYRLHTHGASDIPESEKTSKNAPELLTNRRFSGLDGDEISDYMAMSHAEVMKHVLGKREADTTYQPVKIAAIPQLRMTRRVAGEYTLDVAEAHKELTDSIGMVSDWRRRGPVFEIPFGTLFTKEVTNLLFAGRCTSVTDAMWDVMRVIPCCAVTGEAAGLAAAMTSDVTTLDVAALQKALRARKIPLHESELP